MRTSLTTGGKDRAALAARPRALVLRTDLADFAPAVWRRACVDDSIVLAELHHGLHATSGQTDAHLHELHVHNRTYALPDAEDAVSERNVIDERLAALGTFASYGARFEYLYDFGEDWLHCTEVERTVVRIEPLGVVYVEAGERACPPEDYGGPRA